VSKKRRVYLETKKNNIITDFAALRSIIDLSCW
jgi:hypothetical protein